MNFINEIKLEKLLRARAKVPASPDLEQKILNAVKFKNQTNFVQIFDFTMWINKTFASLSWLRTNYALTGVLIIGLFLGFADQVFIPDYEYQTIGDLFYKEEILL